MFKGLDTILPQEETEEKICAYDAMQEKFRNEDRYKKYKESGVPEKFFCESFATYEETALNGSALKTVMDFAKNPYNRMLVLCGNNGTGKSHLACSIIRECGGEYITSSMLCMKYDSATGYKVDMNREELIRHYSKVDMLVIDECCKYFVNDTTEKFVLMQIICMRYENNKPTVLVTNASKKSFVNFLGTAVFDRFTEVCTTLTFDWESKRKSRRKYA
ncbi:ATP-binding protein [Treponema bryantii]|nr:ATP-binding protein [Treponema bryantii]